VDNKANIISLALAMVRIFNAVRRKKNQAWLRQYRADLTLVSSFYTLFTG